MRERALAAVRRDLASRRVLDPPARSFPAFYVNEMRTALDHPLVALEFEEIFDQGRRLGVQIMSPYNDADLVAFLYRTPPEILNRGGRSKGLVRDAVDRRFPQLGFERQRKVTATGFGKSIVVTEGVKAFQKVQGGLALAEHGVVAEEPLKEHLNAVLRDPRGLPHVLWEVLTLEAWLRTNC
jgi:hypothetical protein